MEWSQEWVIPMVLDTKDAQVRFEFETEDGLESWSSTHAKERAHVNLEAFPAIAEILDRIRKHDGCLGAQHDWLKEICPPDPVPFLYERKASQTSEDVTRAVEVGDVLNLASHALRQILECISFQAATCANYIKTLRLRKDLSSLPDEVLAAVLEHSAYTHDIFGNEELAAIRTVKVATALSHTCQRFRRLVVRIPRLWSRIYNTMPPQMVSACCDRLKIANAEIVLCNLAQPTLQFIRTATNHSRYWHRYNHSTECCYVDELQKLAKASRNLNAPSLFELIVRHPSYAVYLLDQEHASDQEAVHYYSTWSMPRLSSLIMENIIPIPFARPVSLRSLSIYMNYWDITEGEQDQGWINVRALVNFLASCTVLEELALSLSFANDIARLILPMKERLSLDRVTKLTLTFERCGGEFVKSMLDAIYFPIASAVELNIRSGYESDSPDRRIDNVLLSILPDAFAFPKLSDLRLELDVELGSEVSPPISLPFSSLTEVRHLFLKTEYATLAAIPDGSCLPALRSLVLKDCKRLEPDWIALFLGRLNEKGFFQPSQLKAEGCKWMALPADFASDEPSGEEMNYVDVTADEMLHFIM